MTQQGWTPDVAAQGRSGTEGRAGRATAREYVARLRANGEDYHAHRIDHEEFTRRQFATWGMIQSRSERMTARVHAMLREASVV